MSAAEITRPLSSPGRPSRRRHQAAEIARMFVPFLAVAGVAAVWLVAVPLFQIPTYILPPLGDVLSAFWNGLFAVPFEQGFEARAGLLLPLWQTTIVVIQGFVFGSLAAILIGTAMSLSRTVDQIMLPIFTALQSIPKVALAPILVIWFGFSSMPRIVLAALLVFFPVLINFRAGLIGTDSGLLAVGNAFNATRLRRLRYIQMPAALPSLFTGLEIGIVYSLLGTIVGEFTAGSEGLGRRMILLQSTNSTDQMFAVIVIFALLGSILSALVRLLRKAVVTWSP